jgi:hypothetical protein
MRVLQIAKNNKLFQGNVEEKAVALLHAVNYDDGLASYMAETYSLEMQMIVRGSLSFASETESELDSKIKDAAGKRRKHRK